MLAAQQRPDSASKTGERKDLQRLLREQITLLQLREAGVGGDNSAYPRNPENAQANSSWDDSKTS